MHEWQEDLLNGITKGHMPIIAMGRRTGKSMYWARMAMQMTFTGCWSTWKRTSYIWPWKKKKSIDGKKIWGHINTRHHKLMVSGRGTQCRQYATDAEVFKKCLKDGGEGW